MPEKFYRLSDMAPPLGVRVRVLWDGRGPFEAARVAHPKIKKACWLIEVERRPVFLPDRTARPVDPKSPWNGLHTLKGDNPEFWAPIRPDLWSQPLPTPAFLYDGTVRMWTAGQCFDATEAAAEMEADRENVSRGTVEIEKRGARVAEQWWRDASQIRYEPADSLTPRMAEGRIMRAVACCGAGRGLTLKTQTFSAIVAAVAEAIDTAVADAASDYVARFEPLPRDHQDFLTAMGWFSALNPPELRLPSEPWGMSRSQIVLVRRAQNIPWSFDEIGDAFDVSGERARQINIAALRAVWQIGAGLQKPSRDHIGELRERNRKAKREAAI